MKKNPDAGLETVKEVYSGPEANLWELVMGEQIHIGGLESSLDLAEQAGIEPGTKGVDLCCCTGAGMRFLLRFRGVASMHGVDATERMLELGSERSEAEGFDDKTNFVMADACDTGLEEGQFDFAWGEDAWCYVEDKSRLVAEAVRLVKTGGTIAFTDWIEGETPISDEDAERFMKFMKFPNIFSKADYCRELEARNCHIIKSIDTGRFANYVALYMDMLIHQLTYDALKIIGFDLELMQAMGREMEFMRELAGEGKICQGLFIAGRE